MARQYSSGIHAVLRYPDVPLVKKSNFYSGVSAENSAKKNEKLKSFSIFETVKVISLACSVFQKN